MAREVIKLVIAGPVNAGKTTLIRSVSDVPVVCTNELAGDDVSHLKDHTTVAMDHGICHVEENLEIHLYGTPGQRRFDFMWEILAVGADGIVFLVDGSDPQSLEDIRYIYDHFDQRHDMPVLVALTRHEQSDAISVNDLAAHLELDGVHVVGLDPRESEQAKALMLDMYRRLSILNRTPSFSIA